MFGELLQENVASDEVMGDTISLHQPTRYSDLNGGGGDKTLWTENFNNHWLILNWNGLGFQALWFESNRIDLSQHVQMAFIAKECYSKQITLWVYFSNSTQSTEMEIEWWWEFPFGSSPRVIGRPIVHGCAVLHTNISGTRPHIALLCFYKIVRNV